MDRAPTRLVTLNHLTGLRSIDDAAQAIAVDDTDHDGTDRMRVTIDRIDVGGCPAMWFTFQDDADQAPWAHDAETLLGRPLDVREQRSGGVLVIDVDGRLYAISFGQGFRRILDGYRDQRFGLQVAIRCLDGAELNELVRRRPGIGRIDSTLVPGGAPGLWLRPGNLSEIVRRMGGRTLPMELTYQPAGDRAVKLLGASGLRLRLGLRGEDLVRDIRAIAAIHDRHLPLADLAFVDDVAPVADARTRRQLDGDVEDMLADLSCEPAGAGPLALSVPDGALEHLDAALSYRIAVGESVRAVPDVTLADIATAVRDVPSGHRLAALRAGQIAPCELPGGRRMLVRPAAVRWIEATVVAGDRHFALLDGDWHEFDRDFAMRVEREVAQVFSASRGLNLPPWRPGWDEGEYNRQVSLTDPRYLCLDRKLVRDKELHHGPGLELCDLLGPENELIHVKRAKGSSTLSHLFAQGLVSWLSLRGITETRRRFRALVEDVGGPGRLPADYVPDRVVFAILLGTGRPLTPDTLFPFAQAALAQTAAELRERQVRVDVVGIAPLAAAHAA
jgi:uncharacterized protein (TIGR04141 family)